MLSSFDLLLQMNLLLTCLILLKGKRQQNWYAKYIWPFAFLRLPVEWIFGEIVNYIKLLTMKQFYSVI